jgi:hypothetical protein
VVGVVLLLTAAGTVAANRPEPPVDPAARPPVAADQPPAPAPGRVKPVAARSAPVALRIPAIGVAVSVTSLALNADGTVQVPTDYALPGWFRLGPPPGQLGSAVILGHVDSHRGPAVFFRLRLLKPGDRVEVTSADGKVNTFVVRAVETYPKKLFPARLVYGSHGYSALQLVTCGGEFDARTRSYVSNVVAYTALAGTAAAAAAGSPRPTPTGRPAR